MWCGEGPKTLGDAQGLTTVWLVAPWAGILRGPFGSQLLPAGKRIGQDEATPHILKGSKSKARPLCHLSRVARHSIFAKEALGDLMGHGQWDLPCSLSAL